MAPGINPVRYTRTAEEGITASPRWLTIFNDMITLLLVFFVLMFSLGNINIQRFQHFQNALQSAMGILDGGHGSEQGIISQQSMPSGGDNLNTAAQEAIDAFSGLHRTEGLAAELTPRGIQLVLDNHLLFATGSAQLSPNGIKMLRDVGRIIKPFDRYIRIEGHTDNLPIQNQNYPSNWELSAARAISVVTFFIDEVGLTPSRLSAAGYGASRPRVHNDSEDNRAKNRRVEIILGQRMTLQPFQAQQDNGGK